MIKPDRPYWNKIKKISFWSFVIALFISITLFSGAVGTSIFYLVDKHEFRMKIILSVIASFLACFTIITFVGSCCGCLALILHSKDDESTVDVRYFSESDYE